MISDVSLILFAHDAFYTFVTIAPFRYFSLMISALIMHLIIARGRNLLDMTNKLQYYAERDPLTGLYNMRKFDEIAKTFFPTSKKAFIAMIDVDCFKKINDTFGHKIGDTIISSIAQILKKHCSDNCIAARYGGDEFIFLIEADDQDKAYEILDIIRMEVASAALLPKSNNISHVKVSLSIGLSELTEINQINLVIEKADKLLYLAKQQGKNKICG
jgi:diguanylate cyclase